MLRSLVGSEMCIRDRLLNLTSNNSRIAAAWSYPVTASELKNMGRPVLSPNSVSPVACRGNPTGNWDLEGGGNAAVRVGRDVADTADIPVFNPGINRTEWDLFNRLNVGFPLQATGDTEFGDRTGRPIFFNTDAVTGYDQAAAMRELFDVRFNNLTDVEFENNTTTFIEPRFNGLTMRSAPFRAVSSAMFDSNTRVLSVEVLTNSTFQQGELESTFAANTPFRFNSANNPNLAVDLTGDTLAAQFFEGDALIASRVRLEFVLDNVVEQVDAVSVFTDADAITWDIANLNNNGIYTFSINGVTDAQQVAFLRSLFFGLEVQHNRVINHQWLWYDQLTNSVQVTDAQEMRDLLQTQQLLTYYLLLLSSQPLRFQ